MTEIFNSVYGFNLKLPFNDSTRNISYKNSEWVEIIKKPNQLPTVKLTTLVLYYRKNGDDFPSSANNNQAIPGVSDVVADGENYRFYNTSGSNSGDGKQLGWIWGFPLFDVSGGAGSWPRFESCYSSLPGDTSGNQIMLVDLSANKNIIVLDCSG